MVRQQYVFKRRLLRQQPLLLGRRRPQPAMAIPVAPHAPDGVLRQEHDQTFKHGARSDLVPRYSRAFTERQRVHVRRGRKKSPKTDGAVVSQFGGQEPVRSVRRTVSCMNTV